MSNLASYRKYRPQVFADVINQEHVKVTLANAVIAGRVGHAYLFTGPRGVGKTTLARILARAINCPDSKNGEPCNACEICREFLNATSLDFMEIDAASHTGVDNIRELIEHIQFAPTRAKHKVIIIDEVHMLSKGAFNALLKTLEEPPKHAVFVLATTEIHKVPPTIVSRTQRFDFRKAGLSDLVKSLRKICADGGIKASDEALLDIAQASDGSFRDSLSLLDQVISFSQGEITQELTEQVLGLTGTKTTADYLDLLLANNTQGAVNFISDLAYKGRDLFQFQKDFLEYLRKILMIKVGNSPESDYTPEVRERMKVHADAVQLGRLMLILGIYQKAGAEIRHASIQSLPLELAGVEATMAAHSAQREASSSGAEANAEKAENVVPTRLNEANDELLGRVISSWGRVLEKIKEYNHSLLSSLKLAIPAAVEGMHLTVVFPYKFHKEAIEARKNKIVVDQVLEEVTGSKLLIVPVLQKDWNKPLPQMDGAAPEMPPGSQEGSDNLVESALKIMGGEVSEE